MGSLNKIIPVRVDLIFWITEDKRYQGELKEILSVPSKIRVISF